MKIVIVGSEKEIEKLQNIERILAKYKDAEICYIDNLEELDKTDLDSKDVVIMEDINNIVENDKKEKRTYKLHNYLNVLDDIVKPLPELKDNFMQSFGTKQKKYRKRGNNRKQKKRRRR